MDKDYILKKLNGRYTIDEGTGCWVWDGTTEKNRKYYPQICIDNTLYYAYRLAAYTRSNINNINDLGLVKHSCKNKRCINPDHLKFNNTDVSPEVESAIQMYMKDNKIFDRNKAIIDLIAMGITYYYYIKEEV